VNSRENCSKSVVCSGRQPIDALAVERDAYRQRADAINLDGEGLSITDLGIALVFLGFMVVLASAVMMFLGSARERRSVRGGAVIMIGPIPVVFGSDRESAKILMILAIGLMIVAISVMLWMGGW